MEKRALTMKRRALRRLDLPEETDPNVIRIEMLGGETLIVENHRGVLTCGDELIRIQSPSGPIEVTGRGLVLKELRSETIRICGRVRGWRFEGGN